jgi:GntR family transcriptional regulator, transcriptional repressor for pyruvate dehydrogenase complex
MGEHPLRPLRRSPLYEEVVDRLREFIDVQQLKPGDRLMSEREITERLGVSRTSVRQALTALRVLGMVEIRHGDGIYLLRPPADLIPSLALEVLHSDADHPMIWEVREGIEPQAARLAARRRTDTDLAAMAEALEAMEASIAEGGEGVLADRHFHNSIVDAARNQLLRQLYDELAEAINRTSEASLSEAGRPAISLKGHLAVYEAIRRRDEELADQRMRGHLELCARSALRGDKPLRRADEP